ncbi:MAG: hypothetical protein WBP29_05795 [Candidatus Zixiibacteriota bacterium]
MDYNEFSIKRQSIPDIESAVIEFFQRARTASEHRFFLTIIDLHTIRTSPLELRSDGLPRRYTFIPRLGLGIQQYSEFLSAVSHTDLSEVETESERSFLRRLQMLAYSQLWEHIEIQTLLWQLLLIANGNEYDPTLLWENFRKREISCNSIYERIRKEARPPSLTIGAVIDNLYYNQIRNAFVHSQFYFGADLVSFENADLKNPNDIPSLKIEIWDSLFADTLRFVASLFAVRRVAEQELIERCPFTFEVPEILPFTIKYDRGEFRHTET